MSAFTTDWLALREPADELARAPRLVEVLREFTAGTAPRRLVDLGAGTGAALRYLAPRLGGEQRWRLVDTDAVALARARRELEAWARGRGADTQDTDRGIEIRNTRLACSVGLVETDLADGLGAVGWADGAIVSASALLDLVSADWLAALVEACTAGRHPVWLTLCYDGRIELEPPDPLDRRVREAFNRDQRRDKGFGPALGPIAARRAAESFASAGFAVDSAASDWVLDARSTRLGAELIEIYRAAAAAAEPASAAVFGAWHAQRAEQLAAGGLTVRVGHMDLLALPA